MNVLNLDALAPASKRAIVLGGVEHKVMEMTVSMFVSAVKEAKRLKSVAQDDPEQLEATVAFIGRAIPTLETETIRALTLDQMRMLTAFINGDMDDKIKEEAEEEVEGQTEGN